MRLRRTKRFHDLYFHLREASIFQLITIPFLAYNICNRTEICLNFHSQRRPWLRRNPDINDIKACNQGFGRVEKGHATEQNSKTAPIHPSSSSSNSRFAKRLPNWKEESEERDCIGVEKKMAIYASQFSTTWTTNSLAFAKPNYLFPG